MSSWLLNFHRIIVVRSSEAEVGRMAAPIICCDEIGEHFRDEMY